VKNLRVTIIQSEITWHNITENLDHFESLIKKNNAAANLIILPEMFNTGFTMKPAEVSEEMTGPSVIFLRRLAREVNADIAGSIAIRENGAYYNRLVWLKPSGELFTYDKRHLFRMGGEEKVYTPGKSHLTININGWRIRPFICYDLRFPVWTRNSNMEYDLAVFTANWPAARDSHWDTLLRARAIENQCYVAGVNRTGADGNGITYNGRSSVIDFYGNVIYQSPDGESVQTVELSFDKLSSYRNSFPAWMDSDRFRLS
jgi:predicted amidohydrolase